jgi:hypothetical protein
MRRWHLMILLQNEDVLLFYLCGRTKAVSKEKFEPTIPWIFNWNRKFSRKKVGYFPISTGSSLTAGSPRTLN